MLYRHQCKPKDFQVQDDTIMKRLLLSSFIILIACHMLQSQNRTIDFKISLPKKPISNSIYKTILYVDSRDDTTYMGTVASGLLKTGAAVSFSPPLSVQLTDVLGKYADKTAKDGTMLFQLRHLVFSQKPGAFSNKGYCLFKAELYADKGNGYVPLASVDTMIIVKTLTTGTSSLFNAAGNAITSFIADNLIKSGSDTLAYNYNDVLSIDSLEKTKIPIYNSNASYVDGIYEKWESFKKQIPEWTSQMIAEPKGGRISSVEFIDKDNKKLKLESKLVYAIVLNGQPYVSTDYGYYLLEKRERNFFFTGKAKVYTGMGERYLSRSFLGPLSALYELNQNSTFEFKIDHSDGGFIRIKEIKSKHDTQ